MFWDHCWNQLSLYGHNSFSYRLPVLHLKSTVQKNGSPECMRKFCFKSRRRDSLQTDRLVVFLLQKEPYIQFYISNDEYAGVWNIALMMMCFHLPTLCPRFSLIIVLSYICLQKIFILPSNGQPIFLTNRFPSDPGRLMPIRGHIAISRF